MTQAIDNEMDILHRAKFEGERGGTYKPSRGQNAAARRLVKRGLIREAGISVTWPHKVYVITDAGLSALSQRRKT